MLCNCTQCQRRTGSVYGVAAYFGQEQVRPEGVSKRSRRTSDAGRSMELVFCPECGSTVYWKLDLWPERIAVAVGAFASTDFPAPHVAVWTEQKCDWVPLPEGVPQRSKQG